MYIYIYSDRRRRDGSDSDLRQYFSLSQKTTECLKRYVIFVLKYTIVSFPCYGFPLISGIRVEEIQGKTEKVEEICEERFCF